MSQEKIEQIIGEGARYKSQKLYDAKETKIDNLKEGEAKVILGS